MIKDIDGVNKLMATLRGDMPQPSNAPYDEDTDLIATISTLEYINAFEFMQINDESYVKYRSRIRYLAALFPEASLNELTNRIHGLLNNKNMDMGKLRLMLQGKHQFDPSKNTNEIRLAIIQSIGRLLANGVSITATAKELGIAYETVENVERYLGILSQYKLRRIDRAVNAVRDNVSIRAFSKSEGISRTLGRNLLNKGKKILQEIGE